MTELKTLKEFSIISKLCVKEDLRQEAIKWIRFIDNGMKSIDDLMWEKLTGNKLVYDEQQRKVICVFIKHFFNITDKEIEDDTN